jgi:hypothetical protein
MARLPTVGGDASAWGTVLNTYLTVAHNADGTLKNVPSDWLNVVTQYGADPVTFADSTTAFQNALNAVPAAGGVVYIPGGLYNISGALTVNAFTTVRGAGDDATEIRQSSTTANGFTLASNANGITIRDLHIKGPASGSGHGIASASASTSNNYLELQNIVSRFWGGNGFDLIGPIVSVISRCRAEHNGNHGFSLHSTVTCTSITFNSCFALSNTGRGYDLNVTYYSALNGCAADSNGYGYYLTGCQGVHLNACGAEDNVTDSFVLTGGTSNSLTSCLAYHNAHYALHTTGNEKNTFVAAFVENTPTGTPVNSIKTDAGTSITVINYDVVTAASFSGTNSAKQPGF